MLLNMHESNFEFRPISHLEAGDMVAALREWVDCVMDEEDRERVGRLLRECESSLDVVLVSKPSSRPLGRGTSSEGDPRRVGASGLNV